MTAQPSPHKDAVRKVLDAVKTNKRTSLTAPEGKLVCDAYGIPVPGEGVASSAADAAKLADGMGYPVVLKIVSPDILHKTEAGGVIVGVKDAAAAREGYDKIIAALSQETFETQVEKCAAWIGTPECILDTVQRYRRLIGVFEIASARTASAIPGTGRSTTDAVASGVWSRGDKPVPPVVSTSLVLFASSRSAAEICGRSSGTTRCVTS